jgi:pyruvate dehydrogenase E2 component (dihydrolipoamide acetyltransferase)
MEVPTNETGYIRKLFVKTGDTIREKALLCIVTDAQDEAFHEPSTQVAETAVAAIPGRQPPAPSMNQEIPGALRAAPAARRMAKELGIDLMAVQGTGPGGRITVEDVRKAKDRQEVSQTAHEKTPNSETH